MNKIDLSVDDIESALEEGREKDLLWQVSNLVYADNSLVTSKQNNICITFDQIDWERMEVDAVDTYWKDGSYNLKINGGYETNAPVVKKINTIPIRRCEVSFSGHVIVKEDSDNIYNGHLDIQVK